MRLLYAGEDARAFHRYAATAWDAKEDVHHLLVDRSATNSAVRGVFDQVAALGRFDILIVYLSGHGDHSDDGSGSFCLADAQPGVMNLNRSALDLLLERIDADRILLFIDCCYAESVTAGMSLFASLDRRRVRIFVASARSDQRSWEDDTLRRSIFSDVLLRSLSSDTDLADGAGYVDLEARLLGRLREQVPLNAAARKSQLQEPVSGGQWVEATKLPTVATESLGRHLSVAETVRKRVRQVAVGASVAILASLVALDLFAFHLAVSGTGDTIVRPGLQSTYGLMPFHLRRDLETGLKLADFDASREDLFRDLSEGALRGVSTHKDDRGLRTWLRLLEGGLSRVKGHSTAALAIGQQAVLRPDDDPPPVIETLFLARANDEPISDIGRAMYPLDRRVEADCQVAASSTLDFRILEAEQEVFQRDAVWLAVTAPTNAEGRAQRVSDLVRLAAYRAFNRDSGHDWVVEFRSLANAIRTVAAFAVVDRDEAGKKLQPLEGWCHDYYLLASAIFAGGESRRLAEAEFTALMREGYDEGRSVPIAPRHELARIALEELALSAPLSDRTLTVVAELAWRSGLDLSQVTEANRLLEAIAPHQPLPEGLTGALLERMHKPAGENDFAPLAAFALLASNAAYLKPTALGEVRRWAENHAQDERTMSDFHRGLGFLASAGGLSSTQQDILIARLSPSSHFTPRAVNYRGETVITAGGDAAIGALGRAARVLELPEPVLERMANVAMARPLLPDRDEVIRGLAARWYGGRNITAAQLYTRISRFQSDAARRRFEAEVGAMRLASLDPCAREELNKELIEQWRIESEPEIRIAIAQLVGQALLWSHPKD
jgi:hypothetical protein